MRTAGIWLFWGTVVHGFVDPSADERIRYYLQKTALQSTHYHAWAELAAAYLEKTRESHDPSFLPKARAAAQRSMDVQSNVAAMTAMTAIHNFAHRFEDAVRWGRRAAEAAPDDSNVKSQLVEAYLGLGRDADAEKLVPPAGVPPTDFHSAVALGQWLVSRHRDEEAATAFLQAARFAAESKYSKLEVWALVRTAGVWIDSGSAERAAPYLNAAELLDSDSLELGIHKAEWLEVRGQSAEALLVYLNLLGRWDDPVVHAQVSRLARMLGDRKMAQRHFDAAERMYLQVIEAGEVYTLGALARLYTEAGVFPDRARELARRNLEFCRDALAHDTFHAAQRNAAP